MFTTVTIIKLLNLLFELTHIYTILLVVYALLSWFPGGYQSSFGKFLSKICEPYLSLFDRFNFSIGGLDFTIMVAIIVLELAVKGLAIIVSGLI